MFRSISEEGLSQEIERTYFEGLTAFCANFPDIYLRRGPGMTIYATGLPSPMLNGILGARFPPGDTRLMVEMALSHFKNARLPMMWILGPSSIPKELDETLLEQGLVFESAAPGMAVELRHFNEEPLPPGLEVRPVEDPLSLEHCSNLTAEVFGIPAETREAWGQIIRAYGIGPPHKWFLGYLDGVPVSTSLLVLHENVAGIYNVATLKEARGKGIGTALTRVPLLFAKNAGYGMAVLEASEMGRPVYEKLGFEKICELRIFIWSPEGH